MWYICRHQRVAAGRCFALVLVYNFLETPFFILHSALQVLSLYKLAQEFWFTAGQDRNAADIGNASATIACNVVNTRSLEDVLKELRDQDDESTVKMLESELAYAMSQVEELKGQLNEIQKRRKGGKKEGNDGSKRLKLTEGNDDSKRLKLTEGDDEAGGQA